MLELKSFFDITFDKGFPSSHKYFNLSKLAIPFNSFIFYILLNDRFMYLRCYKHSKLSNFSIRLW